MSITLASTTDTPEQVQAALKEFGYEQTATETLSSAAETEEADKAAADKKTDEKLPESPDAEAALKAAGEGEDEIDSESETEEDKQEQDPEKPKRKSTFMRRVEKVAAKVTEDLTKRTARAEEERDNLKRMLAEKEAAPSPKQEEKPEPKAEAKAEPQKFGKTPDDFETYEEFTEAQTEWKIAQAIQAARAEDRAERERVTTEARTAKVLEVYTQRVDVAKAEHDDYAAVAGRADVQVTPAMQRFILTSEVGPEAAYFFGSNPEKAAEICRMDEFDQTIALGKLEAQLSVKKAPEPKKSTPAATPPVPVIKPVRAATSAVTKDPNDMDFEEYKKWRAGGGGT